MGFLTSILKWVFLLLLLLIGLSGCSFGDTDLAELTAYTPSPQPPTRRPTITPAPSATPTNTPKSIVPTAFPTATATAPPIVLDETQTLNAFVFEYPSALVRNSSPRLNQPQGYMMPFSNNSRSNTLYPGVPDILVVDLALVGQNRPGQLILVTYADERGNIYDAFDSGEREALLKLRARVGSRNTFEPRSSFIPEAFVGYVNLKNGAAVRGVQYDPISAGAESVGDDNLNYLAEGIIGGRYFFHFRFPVDLPDFPDGIPLDGGPLAAKSAVDQTMGWLEQEGSQVLWPHIDLLDGMVASLALADRQRVEATPETLPTATIPPPPAVTPTPVIPTPPPANTPTTGAITVKPLPTNFPGCSNFVSFVADKTVPDGSRLAPGATFVKTWRVINEGTCHFDAGYVLTPFQETMAIISILPLPVIPAGERGELSVVLRAPETPGRYRMDWQMVPPDDRTFSFQEPFGLLYVDIVVDPDVAPPTPVP